ncbi:heme-binding protein [Geodermatophilus sabuli]|uniref:Heme-binding protein n=1 Tax=Geodermatophilus sabuli TaxID=1564158 RepID=A0A7K3W4V9_9ACTN|nr:heme-binding protein [Geodermatophilus sabuli]NEK59916.1 heme-binding protein [Geodermatophilus sabuli]
MAHDIGQQLARTAADAALAHATTIGLAVSVAVVDAAGWDVVVVRGDDTPGFTAGIARVKAATAVAFRRPTGDLAAIKESRPEVIDAVADQLSFRPTTLRGGLPLLRDGAVVGAIGVSGGTGEQDIECAEAALAALDLP